MTENFQDGCDTIVAGCTTYGSTPKSNSPSDIVNSIKTIYTNRYNSGVTKGQNDVKTNPNGYGFYTRSQYDDHYNNGYNSGRTRGQNDVKGNPNSYGLYTKAQYDSHYTSGYNAGVTAGKNSIAKNVTIRSRISSSWGGGSASKDYDIAVAIKNNGTVTATGSASWKTDGNNSITVTNVL